MDTRSCCQESSRERTSSLLARRDVCSSSYNANVSTELAMTEMLHHVQLELTASHLTNRKIFQLTIWIVKGILLSLDTLLHNLQRIQISYSRLRGSVAILSSQMQKIVFSSSDLWARRWKFLTKWKYPGHQSKRSWKGKDYLRI